MLKTLSDIYLPLCRGHLNSGIFLWAYDCGTKGLIASSQLINILICRPCSVIISGCYTCTLFCKLQKFCFFLLLSFCLDHYLYVWCSEYLYLFIQFAFVRMKTDAKQSVPNFILVVFYNGGSRRWFIYIYLCVIFCFYFKCASEISYDWITRRLLDLWNMKCSKYFNVFGPCVMREPENLSLFLFWCPLVLFACVVCRECGYHIEGWFEYEIIDFWTKKPDESVYG